MRQYNLPKKRRQKGFTLAEILFGLVIIIAGAVIALTAFNQANSSQEGKEAQDQITQILGAVRKVYPGPSYNGVSATSLVNRGVAPSTMVSGTTLVNTYGGTVTLAAASVASGTDNAVTITFPQVPRAECNVIIAQTHSLFGRVVVGTTSVKDQFAATPSAFNSATMETACNNERNSIAFTAAG
jgi:type II secretory pathway pseudopilin PulG